MDESILKRGSSFSGLVKLGCEVKVPGTGFQYLLHSYQLHHNHLLQQHSDTFDRLSNYQSTTRTVTIVGVLTISLILIFAVSLLLTGILLKRNK